MARPKTERNVKTPAAESDDDQPIIGPGSKKQQLKDGGATAVNEPQWKNEGVVDKAHPFEIRCTIVGTDPILFHSYDCEAVASKGAAKKGSAEKKTDNLESYVYRDGEGFLIIPGTNIKACISEAAKSYRDPRSPRKSAHDMMKAGIKVTNLNFVKQGPKGFVKIEKWDYEDKRRVCVQQVAITRVRPAMREGWRGDFTLRVLVPEYLPATLLHQIVTDAGRLIGLLDFRPDFGTFQLVKWEPVGVPFGNEET